MSRAKNWCFTLNNFTVADETRLQNLTNDVVYLIAGREVGPSGTPHLQGFVQFQSRKTLNQVIAIIGQCHCTITRSVLASIEYCKKDGDWFEIGATANMSNQGKRNDIEAFKDTVKNGERDPKKLREDHSEVAAKYHRFFVEYVRDNTPEYEAADHPFREWQQTLSDKLDGEPDERSITFIVDTIGNQGKSWFCHNYSTKNDNCQVLLPGKKVDMAFALVEQPRVIFVDTPRSKQGEYVQYDFLEEVKNGYVFSSKYESRIKRFKAPWVVVCMNEAPDMSKLSMDRYDVITL